MASNQCSRAIGRLKLAVFFLQRPNRYSENAKHVVEKETSGVGRTDVAVLFYKKESQIS